MKNLYLVVLLFLSIVACDKTGEEKPSPEPSKPPVSTPYLELSTLSLDFESGEETKTIIVDSMSNDTIDVSVASEDELWCSASFENKVISVSVTENDGADTRDSEITVVCDGLTKKVTITQLGQIAKRTHSLKVLGLNVWNDGYEFSNAFGGLVDAIDQTDSDVILLQEVRSQGTINTLIQKMKEKGKTYYGKNLTISSALMSKYPLTEVASSVELGSDSHTFTKGTISIKGQEITLYSAHLDWVYSGYYLAKGYDGLTWDKLDAPILDVDSLLRYSSLSKREKEVETLMVNMQKEIEKGRFVIFAGDFNEASHLDWQEDTKDIRNHSGLIVNWKCSMLLQEAGYKDAYREIYPNPVSHPGFTCNAGNKDADPSRLTWSLGIDDRERIDFIYYFPNKKLTLKEIAVVGPKEDFYDGKIQFEQTEDNIIEPRGIWSSDHKGLLAEFELEEAHSVIIPAFGEADGW